ncbi:MAG TPA: rhomboid family intramembrane serine protease [Candidatus Obscuribacterales bacterium]
MTVLEKSPYKALEESVVPPKPLVTTLLVLLCLWGFYEFTGHGLLWAKNTAFSGGKFIYQLDHGVFDKMAGMMFWATFVQTSIWHFLGNIYFLWVFGSYVEPRLGNLRFALLVLALIFGGWYLQGMYIGTKSPYLFIGPALLTAGIIGAYLNFFPEKKINPGGQFKSYRIFKREKDPDPSESFGISPWIIILAFIAYEVLMHFLLNKMNVQFDNMSLVTGLGSALLGLVVALVLVMVATSSIGGHPLRRLAVQRYQQLRALDMTHDEAILGAAKLLSIPPEQVKAWVAKGGGPLPQA